MNYEWLLIPFLKLIFSHSLGNSILGKTAQSSKNVNVPLISFPHHSRFDMKIIIQLSKFFPLCIGMSKKPMFTIKSRFYRKQRFFAHPNARRENFETLRIFFLANLPWGDHVYGIFTFSCFKTALCLVTYSVTADSTL